METLKQFRHFIKDVWHILIGMRDGTTRIERMFILRHIRNHPSGYDLDGDMIYFQRLYYKHPGKYSCWRIVTTGIMYPIEVKNKIVKHCIQRIFKRYKADAISIAFNLLTNTLCIYTVDMQEELLK